MDPKLIIDNERVGPYDLARSIRFVKLVDEYMAVIPEPFLGDTTKELPIPVFAMARPDGKFAFAYGQQWCVVEAPEFTVMRCRFLLWRDHTGDMMKAGSLDSLLVNAANDRFFAGQFAF